MTFYNLPPAWDPGFCLPKNVQDEGLERRAFVTKQMPRGTYDNPSVGDGGYDVPQYIKDEGYGQGTFTTRWPPDGTYDGPKIPHWLNQRPKVTKVTRLPGGGRRVTVQALGDDPLPEPFESYGQRAAATVIAHFAPLPTGLRQVAMRRFLDTVDKSLWSRTQDFFRRYVQQKIPPQDAFPLALARALSTGIVAEIILTGKRGEAPQATSLLGLGCYGCGPLLGAMALGDATVTGCQPAPEGFTWIYGATVNGQWIPGHWARLEPGKQAQPFCSGGPPFGSGATTVADLVASGAQIITRDHAPPFDFWVGPFGFDTKTLKDRVWAIGGDPSPSVSNRAAPPDIMYVNPDPDNHDPPQPQGSTVRKITPEILAWMKARLTEETDPSGQKDVPRYYTDKSEMNGFPEPDAPKWFDAMGISPTTPMRFHKLSALRTAGMVWARTKHIKTGADMVLAIQLGRADFRRDYDPKTNGLALKVWLARVPDRDIFGALWNPMILINPLTAMQATASVVAGLAPILGEMSCDVLKNPATGVVAGAVAAYYGMPPQAGQQGVAIAADQCGQPPPPPPPPVVKRPIWTYVLLAGGGILTVAMLTAPHKKGAPR